MTAQTATEPGSTLTARAVVRALVAQGVRDVVLCPGSRSAPLAYAILAAHEAGWLRLHVRVDERAAAFLALGLTRAPLLSGPDDDGARDDLGARPVAVVTTSGTAVANLHPAVLEAAHAGRPLVVITADRPHEMRGTGANQTTVQPGIFGSAVRWSADVPAGCPDQEEAVGALGALVARAVAAARGLRTNDPGPVHLNVALREPLTPASPWVPGHPPTSRPWIAALAPGPVALAGDIPLARGPRTVVVAGDGAGPTARVLAEAAGWPLFAEPSSGARCGPTAIGPYRALLDLAELAGPIERVVVFGHPTLSRPVSRLLARGDVEVVVVAPSGATWPDVAGTAVRVCPAVTVAPSADDGAVPPGERAWLSRWRAADAAARAALDAHLARGPLTGPTVAREAAHATAVGAGGARTLVVAASLAVRDLDLAAAPPDAVPVRVLANRGLAGIDGTLATASGIALGMGEPVRAVVGDLAFQHDVGALATGRLEAVPDLQVIVLNDDGGGIFATLEHGAPPLAEAFERVFAAPQGLDIGALAAGFGARYVRVADLAGFRSALAEPVRGRVVVEVPVRRADVRARNDEVLRAVREAARAATRSA